MADSAITTGMLPVERLIDIHDLLTLALDATESRNGYTQSEREGRSYIRSAQRHVDRILGSAGA